MFGEELRRVSEPIGFKTNNEAEYHALIRALEEASRLGAEEVELFSDSELLVKQIRGEYSVKEPRLRKLYARAAELISRFRKLDVLHIDRGANREADKLAREAARRAGCS